MRRAAGIDEGGRPQGEASTVTDIVKESLHLLSTEFRLLRAELGEKIGVIGLGIGLATGGTFLLIAAIVLLFVAAISVLLDRGFGLTLATLIVFGIVLITGAGCLWVGVRQ